MKMMNNADLMFDVLGMAWDGWDGWDGVGRDDLCIIAI